MLNDSGEIGNQGLNVKDALNGTWSPVDDDGGSGAGDDPGTGGGGDPEQITVVDAITKLQDFDSRQKLDDWVSALPKEISGDPRFSEKYRERFGELK
jgi:hypothetical protein